MVVMMAALKVEMLDLWDSKLVDKSAFQMAAMSVCKRVEKSAVAKVESSVGL